MLTPLLVLKDCHGDVNFQSQGSDETKIVWRNSFVPLYGFGRVQRFVLETLLSRVLVFMIARIEENIALPARK